jgi:hypothetical protein
MDEKTRAEALKLVSDTELAAAYRHGGADSVECLLESYAGSFSFAVARVGKQWRKLTTTLTDGLKDALAQTKEDFTLADDTKGPTA